MADATSRHTPSKKLEQTHSLNFKRDYHSNSECQNLMPSTVTITESSASSIISSLLRIENSLKQLIFSVHEIAESLSSEADIQPKVQKEQKMTECKLEPDTVDKAVTCFQNVSSDKQNLYKEETRKPLEFPKYVKSTVRKTQPIKESAKKLIAIDQQRRSLLEEKAQNVMNTIFIEPSSISKAKEPVKQHENHAEQISSYLSEIPKSNRNPLFED